MHAEKDWNRIQARWTVAGVIVATVIGVAALILPWWMWRHKPDDTLPGINMVVTWVPPAMIVASMLLAAWLHYRAIVVARNRSPQGGLSSDIGIESPSGGTTGMHQPPKTIPLVGVTLRDAIVEPYDHNPKLHYPRKLRLYLSNDGSDIELGKGSWLSEGVGLQKGEPSRCEYQIKNHLGEWDQESSIKMVLAGKWFRLYVGLDSTVEEQKLRALAKEHSLGVLQIPARVDGVDVFLRIRP